MKRSGEGIFSGLAFDFAPAAIFGSAAGFASSTALALPRFDIIPLASGLGAFAASWLVLRRFGAEAKSLPLAEFDQSDLERELEKLAEELQINGAFAKHSPEDGLDELILEDELTSDLEDELLLEEQLPSSPPEEDSRVIRLFDPRSETAGEMQERIEHHLRNTPRPQLSDATQELHEALSALRHSLR